MYGTWIGTTLIGVLVLAVVIGLFVLASPIFAVIIVLLLLAGLAAAIVMRRGQQGTTDERRGGNATAASAPDGGAAAGRPAPGPRSGGAPVSGEGHARGGETAGR